VYRAGNLSLQSSGSGETNRGSGGTPEILDQSSRDNENAMAANNIHIPDDLLTEMNEAAQAQGKTADDLVTEAARRYLERKALDDLAARGRIHAQRAGRHESDAVAAVRDVRRGR
jgi:hypothetical protein